MASEDSPHPFHWRFADLDDKNFQVHGRSLLVVIVLFSLLLLSTLFSLYARWFCRHRRLIADSGPTSTATPQQTLTHQARSLGLDPSSIDRLPIFLHRSIPTSSDEAQCSICLSVFQDEEKVKILPECNHAFHPDCVDKWLFTHSSCPICRACLRSDLVVS